MNTKNGLLPYVNINELDVTETLPMDLSSLKNYHFTNVPGTWVNRIELFHMLDTDQIQEVREKCNVEFFHTSDIEKIIE